MSIYIHTFYRQKYLFTPSLMQYTLTQNTIKHFLHIILGCRYVGVKIRIQREKKIDFKLRLLNSLFLLHDGRWPRLCYLDCWIQWITSLAVIETDKTFIYQYKNMHVIHLKILRSVWAKMFNDRWFGWNISCLEYKQGHMSPMYLLCFPSLTSCVSMPGCWTSHKPS